MLISNVLTSRLYMNDAFAKLLRAQIIWDKAQEKNQQPQLWLPVRVTWFVFYPQSLQHGLRWSLKTTRHLISWRSSITLKPIWHNLSTVGWYFRSTRSDLFFTEDIGSLMFFRCPMSTNHELFLVKPNLNLTVFMSMRFRPQSLMRGACRQWYWISI